MDDFVCAEFIKKEKNNFDHCAKAEGSVNHLKSIDSEICKCLSN